MRGRLGAHEVADGLTSGGGRGVVRGALQSGGFGAGEHVVGGGAPEGGLGVEVVGDRPLGHAGPGGDVPGARRLEPTLDEGVDGGRHDALGGLFPLLGAPHG